MIYLVYISLLFSLVLLINATINLLFNQKPKKIEGDYTRMVSVLIPARNEEKNIAALIDSIINLEYKNIEVLVFDDQSTDNTADIVTGYSKTDPRIRLIRSDGLPGGWLGKNFACHSLAKEAKGDFFLFVDADVRLEKKIITDAVGMCDKNELGLLSIFPRQILLTVGEKITVPVMNYILLSLLPLIFVRYSPFRSHSAANGQFMFFRAGDYNRETPHRTFKNAPVEDIKIAGHFKKERINIACLASDKRVSCHMYSNYTEALNGFAKNVFMFFGGHVSLAVLFWTLTTLGFVPMLFVNIRFLLVYLAIVITTRAIISVTSGQNAATNILLMPLQQLFLLHVLIKAIISSKHKNYKWKGRNIYS